MCGEFAGRRIDSIASVPLVATEQPAWRRELALLASRGFHSTASKQCFFKMDHESLRGEQWHTNLLNFDSEHL